MIGMDTSHLLEEARAPLYHFVFSLKISQTLSIRSGVLGVVAHPYKKTSKAQKNKKNSFLQIAPHPLSTGGMRYVFMDKLIQLESPCVPLLSLQRTALAQRFQVPGKSSA